MSSSPARDAVLAGIVLAVSLLFAVYLGALGIILPVLGHQFGLGTEVQGRLFPANFSGCVTGVLLCGPLSDRWGRKPVLLVCFATAMIGLFLFGTAPAFPTLLIAAALVGAGSAAGQTVGGALLSDLFPSRRAVFLNGTQVAFGVGAICGPAIMGTLTVLPNSPAWRLPYLIGGMVQAACLLLLAVVRVPRIRHDNLPIETSGIRLLRERPLLLLCLSSALYSGAEVAIFSWMPTRLRAEVPDSGSAQAAVVSIFWVGMTIGRSVTGLLLNRVPLTKLRLLLAGSGALASAASLFAPTAFLSLVGVGISGLCFSGIFSVLLAESGDRYPRNAGVALGLLIATSCAGSALIPWVVGVLSGAGLPWSIALAPVPLAMATVTLLAAVPHRRLALRKSAA